MQASSGRIKKDQLVSEIRRTVFRGMPIDKIKNARYMVFNDELNEVLDES
jgi:hypothetical protein